MTEPTCPTDRPHKHPYWTLPRPSMMWSSIAVPFVAVGMSAAWPVVLISVLYPLALYFMRGMIDKGDVTEWLRIWRGHGA